MPKGARDDNRAGIRESKDAARKGGMILVDMAEKGERETGGGPENPAPGARVKLPIWVSLRRNPRAGKCWPRSTTRLSRRSKPRANKQQSPRWVQFTLTLIVDLGDGYGRRGALADDDTDLP